MRRKYPWKARARLPQQLDLSEATLASISLARKVSKTPQYLQLREELAPYVRNGTVHKMLVDAVLAEFIDLVLRSTPNDLITNIKIHLTDDKDISFRFPGPIEFRDKKTGARIIVNVDYNKLSVIVKEGKKK